MKLVVVVPVHEHFGYARFACDSIRDTTPDSHIVLVDDASKDWSKQIWEKWPLKMMHRHHYPKNFGLTRSWNYGLRWARDNGAEYVCCTNSDVIFTENWFHGIEWALNNGADLAGPLTNAPGHQAKQQVRRHLPDYKLTDDREYLRKVAARLADANRKSFTPVRLNGFCMVARTQTWWQNAHDKESVFDPKFKMTRNEDELQGRWKKRGLVSAVVPSSFVFHYRGVSRRGATRGRDGHGWFRHKPKK